uniref:Uncharacterized protein n=1 Tax=Romanomermis culicivorax TaxID=13658 RepID=A0A915JH55_ROMCU
MGTGTSVMAAIVARSLDFSFTINQYEFYSNRHKVKIAYRIRFEFYLFMGCTASSLVINNRRHMLIKQDPNTLNDPELLILNAPLPKIQAHIGSGAQKFNENKTIVIFVFGKFIERNSVHCKISGPGSMKGILMEELVAAFNFTVLTTEDIVLTHLPNKVTTNIETAQDIKDLIITDPSLLTLEWVLSSISARIMSSNSKLFLIDIVANLNSILNSALFSNPDIKKELASFERKHPCLFSINLNVPELSLVCLKSIAKKDRSSPEDNGIEKPAESEKDKSKSNNDVADEMDTSRLKKRYEVYIAVAKPFMDYFEETGRLITVEVQAKQKDAVWKKMQDILRDFGFVPQKSKRSVVLFVMDDEQVNGLDTLYYRMLKVNLSAILNNRVDSLEQMIKAVCLYVKRSSSAQNHLIVLDIAPVKCDQPMKRINFLEIRECYLDHYIRHKSNNFKGRPFKKPFKAVITTSNEICLFPDEMDTDLCKKIAVSYTIAESKSQAPGHLTVVEVTDNNTNSSNENSVLLTSLSNSPTEKTATAPSRQRGANITWAALMSEFLFQNLQ